MKKTIAITLFAATMLAIASCKKTVDPGYLPAISFKTGGSYISSNQTLHADSLITIGINASKSEDKDILKKFNISKSVNGATAVSVYDYNVAGADVNAFSYDYSTHIGSTSGETDKYTFTIVNRDGLVNEVSVTLTVQ